MSPASVSVVIPVKNGARWLAEVLDSLGGQGAADVLVIDSGSTDGSVSVARGRGVRVLEIAPDEFGHGRTRNLGVRATSGDLVCFLTQDATPRPGWLEAFREVMSLDPAVGAAFGPHLPRPGTTPMIARELEEFFAGLAGAGGRPRLWPCGEAPFLSNVNACYRRTCLDELGCFPEVAYAEDQAFALRLAQSEWRLAYHPGAAVLHAHDYGLLGFLRRYYDESRGLHAITGHVKGFGLRSTARVVRDEVAADRRWLLRRGVSGRAGVAWTVRAALHHGGRHVASALGSRAELLPAPAQRAISLERTPRPARTARHVAPGGPSAWDAVLRIARDGPAPLLPPVPGMADREHLHIAVVIPPFRRGSGGHSNICHVLNRLEARGHTVTTWLYDPLGLMASEWPARVRGDLREYFQAPAGPVFKGFSAWFGCDVAVATGWETVYAVLGLDHCRARAYLVQDHESEFFPASAQRLWAEQTYGASLHPIASSAWLADLVVARLARPVSRFDPAVDHEVYRPLAVERRGDTVIFYCRDATPRRGAPLGLLALAELHRRRPGTRFLLYGDPEPARTPFAYEHLGVATPAELAREYAQATVGLSLSLTNSSLVPEEMLACGLSCVAVGGPALEGRYRGGGPLVLVAPDPVEIAAALERLLGDPAERERRARAGEAYVRRRTWDRAAGQVEEGLRRALRLRESLETEDGTAAGATMATRTH
jgi:GT2 family glycosyltransferase/glycosyltransferase involved in cell wall biosynthesis